MSGHPFLTLTYPVRFLSNFHVMLEAVLKVDDHFHKLLCFVEMVVNLKLPSLANPR